jgi:hypothetical protein
MVTLISGPAGGMSRIAKPLGDPSIHVKVA